jgi:hypothetical protein
MHRIEQEAPLPVAVAVAVAVVDKLISNVMPRLIPIQVVLLILPLPLLLVTTIHTKYHSPE